MRHIRKPVGPIRISPAARAERTAMLARKLEAGGYKLPRATSRALRPEDMAESVLRDNGGKE